MSALAGHFHDTYGQALDQRLRGDGNGRRDVRLLGRGLGGCPYAKGATGNVASEDVLYLLNGLGIETGVDLTKLRAAGQRHLGCPRPRRRVSRVARALATPKVVRSGAT